MKLIEANPKRSEKGLNKMRPIKELIKGGIADGMSDELFDSVELERGIKVELEHTDNELIAKEIAKDHLNEDPNYYKKLSRVHRNPDNIKELSNTLGRNLQDGMSKIGGKSDNEVVGNMVNILKTARNPTATQHNDRLELLFNKAVKELENYRDTVENNVHVRGDLERVHSAKKVNGIEELMVLVTKCKFTWSVLYISYKIANTFDNSKKL